MSRLVPPELFDIDWHAIPPLTCQLRADGGCLFSRFRYQAMTFSIAVTVAILKVLHRSQPAVETSTAFQILCISQTSALCYTGAPPGLPTHLPL
ncbi:unnamed protein product [Penicillium pancosmium]